MLFRSFYFRADSTIDLLIPERMTDLVKSIGKSFLTISAKPGGAGAVCQLLIQTRTNNLHRSHIATMENGSLCERMKS